MRHVGLRVSIADEGYRRRQDPASGGAGEGSEHVVASKSRGDLWEPGQAVDIRVNPANPAEAMLDTHAGRAQAYLVVGWFIIVVAILTFVGSALLAWATPR